MDVGSNNSYPAGALSNFSGHRFQIDGIDCYSMEGFLQGLKFKNPDMQKEVCKLIGFGAKRKGRKKNWQEKQTLYWKGEAIHRDSDRYQELLDKAYTCMYRDSEKFRNALVATMGAKLGHSIGRRKRNETVLTINEFCSRLMKLRDYGTLEKLNKPWEK